MKIEKAAPKVEGVEDEGGDDKRRARLADLQRLEAALNVVTGKLAEVERLLAGRDSAPVSRSIFYSNFYTFSALQGLVKPYVLRDRADQAWVAYQEALTMAPRRSIEEIKAAEHGPAKPVRPLSEPTPIGEPTPAQFYQAQVQPIVAGAV